MEMLNTWFGLVMVVLLVFAVRRYLKNRDQDEANEQLRRRYGTKD